MIDFELSPEDKAHVAEAHDVAQKYFRPISRYYDENEHEDAWDLYNTMWDMKDRNLLVGMGPAGAMAVEELCWGDAGLYASCPGTGLASTRASPNGAPWP